MEREVEEEYLNDLFKFPIVMADGGIEQRKEMQKEKLNLPNQEDDEMDIVIGEAEYPYNLFVGISDRWLPKKESFREAQESLVFDACYVTFSGIGSFIVPWKKAKFKKEFTTFVRALQKRIKEKKNKEKVQNTGGELLTIPIMIIPEDEKDE